MQIDSIVVGSGFSGAVAARKLAEEGNRKVLLIDKNPFFGGAAYDVLDSEGILIHRFGPHIFHTNEERVYRYLSRFCRFNGYQHRVLANLHGNLIPVPFSLRSIDLCFDEVTAQRLRNKLLKLYGAEQKVPILTLMEESDEDLRRLALFIYENVFLHYTVKQWGLSPKEVDPSVMKRVPVFTGEDDRYFTDTWQGLPADGYTALIERIIEHPGITTLLGTDARKKLTLGSDGKILFDGSLFKGEVIYTGSLDSLFAYRFGILPSRTLDFNFETLFKDSFQPCGTVNYTVSESYTRITEFKYLTGQKIPGKTTIVREFSRAYEGDEKDIPFYPIQSPQNQKLYEQYLSLARTYPNLYLLGRLAEYRYINMDAAVSRALELGDDILSQTGERL